MFTKYFLLLLSIVYALPALASDVRTHVNLPPMMQEHMMANMRDHLLALQTITQQLSAQQYDAAADTAEQRLGMSSMKTHGASHMKQFMPEEMANIGTNMHHAASRFAIIARNAEIDGGLAKAFGALSEVMRQCVACHTSYKIHK